MEIEIITKQDLMAFRQQLLEDIKKLIQPTEQKKWLRSRAVRKLLNISAGTLQNLRVNGTLHPVRLDGSKIWYYDFKEIEDLLTQNNTYENK